jgi:hypothetical protein
LLFAKGEELASIFGSCKFLPPQMVGFLPSFDAENARVALSALKRGGIGVDFWVMQVFAASNGGGGVATKVHAMTLEAFRQDR